MTFNSKILFNKDILTTDEGEEINLIGLEVCQSGDEVIVKSCTPRAVKHLLYGGIHLGGFIGLDLTYVNLREDENNLKKKNS